MENEKILKIDQLIKQSMVMGNDKRDENRTATLRLIKAKYLEFLTAKNAKPLDDAAEINILKKMADERKESIKIYEENNRADLADKEKAELAIIKEFLPAEVTEDQIKEAINEVVISGVALERKNMGVFMKQIKQKYPMADGKVVSTMLNQMF